ncbi:glycoside hydrolase family 18 protein [bacterium]|nr:glycoside hydrolase family 18 protein [bacterium]
MKQILFLMVFASAVLLRAGEKEVIGYYPSWDFKAHRLVNPETIPYEKLDIINYAFARPLPDGTLTGKVPEADLRLLGGYADPVTGKTRPETSLIRKAHEAGVRVMLSLGGWEDTEHFPFIAADPAKRAVFASACMDQIRRHGFDGIDIDWEYPGYAPHNGSPADRENFTLLLLAVRDSLDALEGKAGKKLALSAALSAVPSNVAFLEVEKIAAIMDFLNIMTYDCFGVWDPVSNHNSPLYAPARGDSALNVDSAFRLFHEKHGVPAEKINLGVPFYGHCFSGCTELHGTHTGGDTTICFEPGNITYTEIVRNMSLFKKYWDEKAQVPYLISESRKLFLSYDDERSVGLKADYVIRKGARGLIIWEITDDYFEDGRTPLLDVIHKRFHPGR